MRELYSTQLALAAGILTLFATLFFALRQAPETLTPRPTAAVKTAAAIPHGIEHMELCRDCHGLKGAHPYPARHTGWSNASCTRCHLPPT